MQNKNNSTIHTTDEALALFDSLEPVETEFMIGKWRGEGFPTRHRLDGILEAYHWHGKQFIDTENVHPLVFSTLFKKQVYVNPVFMGPTLKVPVPKSPIAGRLFQFIMPLLTTSKPKARLRSTMYRDKITATMIYDQLPINDVFGKLDENSVLGIMDFKNSDSPFFFILRRELNT